MTEMKKKNKLIECGWHNNSIEKSLSRWKFSRALSQKNQKRTKADEICDTMNNFRSIFI